MNVFSKAFLAAALCAATPSQAENLIFNSSFELDDCGYAILRYIQPSNNKGMEYINPKFTPGAPGAGSRSLTIPNPYAEQIKLYSQEVKLEPGAEYSFSFKAKCNAESGSFTAMFVAPTPASSWDVASKKFSVGKEWKDCSFTFKTAKDWNQPFYSVYFMYGKEKDAPAIDFSFDKLQLNAGGSQKWQPKADIEAASRFSSSYVVIPDGGSKEKVKTLIVNNTDKPVKAELSLSLVPDYSGSCFFKADGEPIDLGSFNVDLAPREMKTVERSIPFSKYGFFRLETAIKSSASSASIPDYCAMIGKYEPKPLDMDTFYAGANFSGTDIADSMRSFGDAIKPAFRSSGFKHSDYLDMYAKMGMRIYRSCDMPFSWQCVEPEKGRFDFKEAELVMAEAEKRGIAIVPTLGNSDFINSSHSHWPEWTKADWKPVKKAGEWSMDVMLPPMDGWRGYIRAVATHFKGRIPAYEIVNEPNGFLSYKDYMDYLKAAYEEIKAADPKAKVIGFCVTGDKGGKLEGFLGDCLKDGALKYADAVSFHPYGASQLGSDIPADRSIERLKAIIDKHRNGKDIQLWNSEDFYLGAGKGDGNDRGCSQPQDLGRRFLIDLGEGVNQGPGINASGLFKSTTSPYFEHLYQWDFSHPSGNLAIYNTMARLFEGAKPAGKVKWPCDAACYVYSKDGKAIAALWSFGSIKGIKLKLPQGAASSLQLLDFYGNKLELNGDTLDLADIPVYLTPKDSKTPAELLALIKSAKPEIENPVSAGALRLIPENGWTLVAAIRNSDSSELSCKVGVQGKAIIGRDIASVTLSPSAEERIVKIPVKVNEGVESDEAELKIQANGKIWSLPVKFERPGKIYEVRQTPGEPVKLKNGNASFSASRDGKTLILHIDVKDNTPSGAPGERAAWNQDCIELFIDPAPGLIKGQRPDLYTDKVARLFVLPYEAEAKRLQIWAGSLKGLNGKSVKCHIDTRTDGYSADVAIPFDAFELSSLQGSPCIGFEVSIDNANSEKRQSEEQWNSTGGAYKNRYSFGFLVFK